MAHGQRAIRINRVTGKLEVVTTKRSAKYWAKVEKSAEKEAEKRKKYQEGYQRLLERTAKSKENTEVSS